MSSLNKNPKVSVIMAVYNGSKTMTDAIDSILNQTYENWEMIVCDDCSTDNTSEVLESYKEKYPEKFILLKNEKNMRLSHSLNRCLAASTGELIARMDADDISVETRFEEQVDFLNKHPEYMVVGSTMERFNETGRFGVVPINEYPEKAVLKKGVPFCHATIMMRKEAYDAVNGYKESPMTIRSQDYDMWFRFFERGFKGYNIQKPLYLVRENMNAIKRRTFKSRVNIMKIQYTGYKLIKAPASWYIHPIVHFLRAFVPASLVMKYRTMQAKKETK